MGSSGANDEFTGCDGIKGLATRDTFSQYRVFKCACQKRGISIGSVHGPSFVRFDEHISVCFTFLGFYF